MDCLVARKSFPAFWTYQMPDELRRQLLSHLADCAGCNQGFRQFALTAPVLHGDLAPRAVRRSSLESVRAGGVVRRDEAQRVERRWALAAIALAMSAAAAVTLYIARPPAPTLEDAFLLNAAPDADSEVHLTNYDSDLFSAQDSGRSSSWGDGESGFTASGKDQGPPNGLAG